MARFTSIVTSQVFVKIRDQMTLILIDTCKVTYRSKGPGVFIYCKLNILHILYIITHVTIIKHLLTIFHNSFNDIFYQVSPLEW